MSRRSYVQMLLVGMNLSPFAMEGFLLSDAEIAEMSETATATKRQKCQDGSYADDHSFLYELAKIPWPPAKPQSLNRALVKLSCCCLLVQ